MLKIAIDGSLINGPLFGFAGGGHGLEIPVVPQFAPLNLILGRVDLEKFDYPRCLAVGRGLHQQLQQHLLHSDGGEPEGLWEPVPEPGELQDFGETAVAIGGYDVVDYLLVIAWKSIRKLNLYGTSVVVAIMNDLEVI